jgi:hypothetical protein
LGPAEGGAGSPAVAQAKAPGTRLQALLRKRTRLVQARGLYHPAVHDVNQRIIEVRARDEQVSVRVGLVLFPKMSGWVDCSSLMAWC